MLLRELPGGAKTFKGRLARVSAQPLLSAGLAAASIVCIGNLAFRFVSVYEVTPVWPPSGIALAALLLVGFRVWFGVLLGFWILDVGYYGSLPIGSMMALGETSEALIAAFLIHRFIGQYDVLGQVQSAFYFVVAAVLAPIGNATLGTTLLYFNGSVPEAEYFEAWRTWWTADAVGILIFTPLLLAWSKGLRGISFSWQKALELVPLISLVIFVSWEAFGQGYPVEYMFLPLAVWSAFRFKKRGATLLLLSVSLISIQATAQGFGTFTRSSQNQSLLFLQSFIGVIAVTTLVLSAVITEREKAELQLKQANEVLESRVEERTAELSQALVNLQRTQAQLIQTEKMSSLGQLVAGVAHEINNPVNFIHGNLAHARQYAQDILDLLHLYQQEYPKPSDTIEDKIEDIELDFLEEDLLKLLNSMRVGSERIREIVKSLRSFSRLDEAEFKVVDIHEGIESTLMILHNRLKGKPDHPGIEVEREYGKLPLVECYPGQLNQVFMNILTNAIDALEEVRDKEQEARRDMYDPASPVAARLSPVIRIRTEKRDDYSIAIHIADNGPGINEEVRSRLFDPFFTTKPVGRGTGLGLAISYQIVTERHGGSIDCISQPNQGTEFVIAIPLKQQKSLALT